MSQPTVNDPQEAEQVLSTLNKDGSRRWLRPRVSPGRWLNRRRWVGYGLIVLFAGLPYTRFDGRPGILLDLAQREFTFFGRVFYATDTVLLALAMLSVFITIFLLTALFGRVWCGWGCPQTVYLELVYRPIERFFDGRHYKTGGSSPGVARQAGKYLTFLIVSFVLANIFLSYFIGTDQLWQWARQSPFEHPKSFLLMAVVTVLMMIDFCFTREQLCILMCPYGRLQSALLDRKSLIVAYDPKRGEPRGKGRRTSEVNATLGDCVDCHKCVVTCPTGIDIRDGLQMECVHCTQCIDACDSIMDKLGKPRGLIRYSSQDGLEGIKPRLIRGRTLIYPLILIVTVTLFGLALQSQHSFETTLLRTKNRTFDMVDAQTVGNILQMKILNRAEEEQRFEVELLSAGSMASGDFPCEIDGGSSQELTLHLETPIGEFDRGRAEVKLRITSESGDVDEVEKIVLGPLYVANGDD